MYSENIYLCDFCSTEKLLKKKKTFSFGEAENLNLYQERYCKHVFKTRMLVQFFECILMSRVSNKYVFFFCI